MSEETKEALNEAFDIIVDMKEQLQDIRRETNLDEHRKGLDVEVFKMCDKALGVLDIINDELYKTL